MDAKSAAIERVYIDSSIILAEILRENSDHRTKDLKGERVTSEVTELECRRTLDRIRLQEQLPNAELSDRLVELGLILKALRIIALNSTVLALAKAPFPTIVRSLDAIHLASADLAKCSVFLTRDRQQMIAAKAIGLKV